MVGRAPPYDFGSLSPTVAVPPSPTGGRRICSKKRPVDRMDKITNEENPVILSDEQDRDKNRFLSCARNDPLIPGHAFGGLGQVGPKASSRASSSVSEKVGCGKVICPSS
jgi:hypothetical protein